VDGTRSQAGDRRPVTGEAAARSGPREARQRDGQKAPRGSRLVSTRRDGVDGDHFGRFLRAAARVPLLTSAEETALSKRVHQGDRDAVRAFVEANIRLIVTIAGPYAHAAHIPLEDLVDEGVFGLWRAAEKFDWRRGTRFSTYATWWIRQAVRRYMMDQRHTLHITGHAQERIVLIRRAEAALTAELHRPPTVTEIAGRARLEPKDVVLLRDLHDAISFEDRGPRTDEAGAAEETFGDPSSVALDERAIDGEILKTRLTAALAQLTRMEREVLLAFAGYPDGKAMTLREIGERLGLSEDYVKAIKVHAVRKLREERLVTFIGQEFVELKQRRRPAPRVDQATDASRSRASRTKAGTGNGTIGRVPASAGAAVSSD